MTSSRFSPNQSLKRRPELFVVKHVYDWIYNRQRKHQPHSSHAHWVGHLEVGGAGMIQSVWPPTQEVGGDKQCAW